MKKIQNKKDTSVATPPTRRVPGPSPASTVKKPAPKAGVAQSDEDEEDDEEESQATDACADVSGGEMEPSEAAKNNRLRRLCEKKPSGRCHVPDDIHLQWVKGGVERQRLRDQLEQCNWEKEWVEID